MREHAVPCRLLRKRLHLRKILLENRPVFFFQRLVPAQKHHCLLQALACEPERILEFFHPERAPWAFLERRNALICRFRLFHPAVHIAAAAHLIVAGKAKIDEPPVVAPKAKLVRHGGEVGLIGAVFVEVLERVLEDLQSDGIGLRLLGYPEIRRQIAQRTVPAQQHRAEGVYR